MTIGEKIRKRRQELGLSVDDIADKLGKNRATVYRYESDSIRNLPISVLYPLAEILRTTPGDLMIFDSQDEATDATDADYREEVILGLLNYFDESYVKLVKAYDSLNDSNKSTLLDYAERLQHIQEMDDYLAAHEDRTATEKQRQDAIRVMKDDKEWN